MRPFILILLIYSTVSAFGQKETLKVAKNYYESYPEDSILSLFENENLNQILFIRHGEPNLNKKGWRNRKQAIQYTIDYDASGIIPFERHPLETGVLENDTVFYSPLARARHTAQLLFQDRGFVLEGDSVFREFERKIIPFLNLKLPLKFYLSTTKIVWFIGLNDKCIETVRCAKKRTRRNNDFLEFRS